MTKWIYLEDFKLEPPLEGIINAEFVVRVEKRIKDAQLVIFFAAQGHADPHVLTFQSQAICQRMYDDLKITLADETIKLKTSAAIAQKEEWVSPEQALQIRSDMPDPRR